jgi:hypothetical protein
LIADSQRVAEDWLVDPFAHDKLRVDTALLEFERHTIKILISCERAHALLERSRIAIADAKDVIAESASAVEALRRERPGSRR